MNDQSPLTKLLQTYGQYLKPLQPFALTQESNMAPFTAAADLFNQQFTTPEYMRQTMNPGMQGIQDTAAYTYGNMMGNNPANMQRQQRALEIPYEEQLRQAQNYFSGLGNTSYGEQYNKYVNSPNALITGLTK